MPQNIVLVSQRIAGCVVNFASNDKCIEQQGLIRFPPTDFALVYLHVPSIFSGMR